MASAGQLSVRIHGDAEIVGFEVVDQGIGIAAEDVERLIDGRTRIVTISSVAFHNGFTADLDAIGDLCARRNVLFCVDGIQSVGALPIDVRKSKIAGRTPRASRP